MQGKQMTLYDLLYPTRINPIVEVAKNAGPYWTTSRQKLIDLCNTDPDIKLFAKAVKEEYCPHGFAGHYGGDHSPNTMQGYEMRIDKITTWFYDPEGERQERIYSWEDFAREIADLIWSGQYEEDH